MRGMLQKRLVLASAIAAASLCAAGRSMAAPTFNDLTAAATLTTNGDLSTPEALRSPNFLGAQWITIDSPTHWAKYDLGASTKHLGYALLGGNIFRVPDDVTVQYSMTPTDNVNGWINAGTVTPVAGSAMRMVAINANAKGVRVLMNKTSAPNGHTDLEAFRVYGNDNLATQAISTNGQLMQQATISQVGTWENDLAPPTLASALTHLSNGLVFATGDSRYRGNGDLATKPELRMSWADDLKISGLAIANNTWVSGSSGSILAMRVDALPTGFNPLLAVETDWFQVFNYTSAVTASKLIDARFDSGSVITRGLRIVITDVTNGPFGNGRSGGDLSEIVVIGGIPEPASLSLLGLAGLALGRRRRV